MTTWDVLKADTMQRANGVEEYRVRRMIKLGKLGPNDSIRKSGTERWIRVADIDPSIWQDELPSKTEQQKLHEKRKFSKPQPIDQTKTTKKPNQPDPPVAKPPEKTAEAPPVEPIRSRADEATPDSSAETIHVENAFVPEPIDSLPTEHQAFAVGPEAPLDEEDTYGKWQHVVPPPVRRASQTDDDEIPFNIVHRNNSEELDLTSMVDVVFLLILFFMVTTTFSLQKSLQIPPPPPEEQAAQQAPTLDDLRDDNIIIDVLEDNTVLLNDRPVSLLELADVLRRDVRETGMNEVIVRAAGDAFHETVVAVFDAANQVGVQRIRLANPTQSMESP